MSEDEMRRTEIEDETVKIEEKKTENGKQKNGNSYEESTEEKNRIKGKWRCASGIGDIYFRIIYNWYY